MRSAEDIIDRARSSEGYSWSQVESFGYSDVEKAIVRKTREDLIDHLVFTTHDMLEKDSQRT